MTEILSEYKIKVPSSVEVIVKAYSVSGAEMLAQDQFNELIGELYSIGRRSQINGEVTLKLTPDQYQEKLENLVNLMDNIYLDIE